MWKKATPDNEKPGFVTFGEETSWTSLRGGGGFVSFDGRVYTKSPSKVLFGG
jgi:hypothetical protein